MFYGVAQLSVVVGGLACPVLCVRVYWFVFYCCLVWYMVCYFFYFFFFIVLVFVLLCFSWGFAFD